MTLRAETARSEERYARDSMSITRQSRVWYSFWCLMSLAYRTNEADVAPLNPRFSEENSGLETRGNLNEATNWSHAPSKIDAQETNVVVLIFQPIT